MRCLSRKKVDTGARVHPPVHSRLLQILGVVPPLRGKIAFSVRSVHDPEWIGRSV